MAEEYKQKTLKEWMIITQNIYNCVRGDSIKGYKNINEWITKFKNLDDTMKEFAKYAPVGKIHKYHEKHSEEYCEPIRIIFHRFIPELKNIKYENNLIFGLLKGNINNKLTIPSEYSLLNNIHPSTRLIGLLIENRPLAEYKELVENNKLDNNIMSVVITNLMLLKQYDIAVLLLKYLGKFNDGYNVYDMEEYHLFNYDEQRKEIIIHLLKSDIGVSILKGKNINIPKIYN